MVIENIYMMVGEGKNVLFERVDQCDYDDCCDYLVTVLLMIFPLLTLVVLFNLLTVMIATTYRLITERPDKEVFSRKVAMCVEYDEQNQVIPPPFNLTSTTGRKFKIPRSTCFSRNCISIIYCNNCKWESFGKVGILLRRQFKNRNRSRTC